MWWNAEKRKRGGSGKRRAAGEAREGGDALKRVWDRERDRERAREREREREGQRNATTRPRLASAPVAVLTMV